MIKYTQIVIKYLIFNIINYHIYIYILNHIWDDMYCNKKKIFYILKIPDQITDDMYCN